MTEALKTKKGYWGKRGQTSGKSMWPGGYKGYTYFRDAPNEYPKTSQQEKVAKGGRMMAERCEGKKGSDFAKCRHDVFVEVGLAKG